MRRHETKNLETAAQSFDAAIAIFPDLPYSHIMVADCYLIIINKDKPRKF
jgi:hypothetical protein